MARCITFRIRQTVITGAFFVLQKQENCIRTSGKKKTDNATSKQWITYDPLQNTQETKRRPFVRCNPDVQWTCERKLLSFRKNFPPSSSQGPASDRTFLEKWFRFVVSCAVRNEHPEKFTSISLNYSTTSTWTCYLALFGNLGSHDEALRRIRDWRE